MKLESPIDNSDAEFDMTPMIDIVFLLIAFFMIVASILTLDRIVIEPPVAPESEIPKESGVPLTLSVSKEGKYYLGLREITLDKMTELVQREKAENKSRAKVYLRADKETEHIKVRDAMAAVAEGGIFNIHFATYQSDK